MGRKLHGKLGVAPGHARFLSPLKANLDPTRSVIPQHPSNSRGFPPPFPPRPTKEPGSTEEDGSVQDLLERGNRGVLPHPPTHLRSGERRGRRMEQEGSSEAGERPVRWGVIEGRRPLTPHLLYLSAKT